MFRFFYNLCLVFLMCSFTHNLSAADCKQKFINYLAIDGIQLERDSENTLVVISNEATIAPFFLDNLADEDCRSLLSRQSDNVFIDEDGAVVVKIDIDWLAIRELVTEALNGNETNAAMMVCENNRAAQVSIEVVSWIPTIVAGVATFGAATIGGAVLKTTAKATAKGMITRAVKQIAKKGLTRAVMKSIAENSFKILLADIGKLLSNKLVRFGLTVGVGYVAKVGTKAGLNNLAFGYSLLESKFDIQMPNCQNLDKRKVLDGSGLYCYKICNETVMDTSREDGLNKFVLSPSFGGKKFCVNRDDYFLYEINPDLSTGKLLKFPPEKWKSIHDRIVSNIKDKNGCNWGFNDADAFTGFLMYSPDDLLNEGSGGMMVTNGVRLDE